MQTAGMLRGTRATYLIALLITLIGCAHSYPLQILPSIPGHVPVYIRHGDEPLDHIHPGLAEAFHEPPSSKSFRLEDFPTPEQISFDEASRYLARFNNKIIFPAYPRDPEASTINSLNDRKDEKKESDDSKIPPLDQVHDDEDVEEEHHGHSKRNPPSLLKEATSKLSPISHDEREGLKKLAVQVAKKAIDSSNHDSNSNQADESSNGLTRKEVLKGFAAAFNIPESEDDDDQKVVDTNEKEPVKQENLETVQANVAKLSPISSNKKKDSAEATSTVEKGVSLKQQAPMNIHILPGIMKSEEISESSETNDSPMNEESVNKMIYPERPLANVDKLLPVSPAEEGTNLKQVTSGPAAEETKKENSEDAPLYVHILPTTSTSMDDSESSKQETTQMNEELPVKAESNENVMGNVLKLSSGSNANKEMVSSDGSVLASVDDGQTGLKKVGDRESNDNHESNVSPGNRQLPVKFAPSIRIGTNVPKLALKKTEDNEKEDEIAME